MALSVVRGVFKHISVETRQSVAGHEATAGAANLSLNTSFANFALSASAHAASTAAVGGLPIFPWWWSSYVAAETARQKIAREAKAVSGEAYAVIPAPWAEAEIEAEPARNAELVAALRPRVEATAFVPRLLAVIDHSETVDDEAVMLLAAALLLAA